MQGARSAVWLFQISDCQRGSAPGKLVQIGKLIRTRSSVRSKPATLPGMNPELKTRLLNTLARIQSAESRFGRAAGSVQLLAVSKTWPAADIEALADLGQRQFGESYVQEALPKLAALAYRALEWHFIGHLQANKTAAISEHFAWAHSVDREKIARRLHEQRPAGLPPLNICLEVNISGEDSKAGVPVTQLRDLAAAVSGFSKLKLRGLMAMPALSADFGEQRAGFARLRNAFDDLNARGFGLDTLSMGTSQDLDAAIAEGATIVRVGTALFGERH